MKKEIINRVIHMADILLENKTTIRDVALLIGYSKSTVHKDLKDKLKHIDYDKYKEVIKLLEYNKNIRHIRGGESTRLKYSK